MSSELQRETGQVAPNAPSPAGATGVTTWPIDQITVPVGREPREERVQALMGSIGEVGLLHPVTVTPEGVLVAGRHRLKACERRGDEHIAVVVRRLGELEEQLATLDENLIRADYDVLERGEMLAKRKAVYEALHPESVRPQGGRPRANCESDSSFSATTAALCGVDRRTVQTDVQIATGIPEDVRDMIRGTPVADMKKELLDLARQDEVTQARIAQKIHDGTARHIYEAKRAVRTEDAIEAAQAAGQGSAMCTVHACSAEQLIQRIAPGAADLILTDPPYGSDALDCYDELGRFAAHALTAKGSLLVMTGQMYLPEVIERLRRHLQYRWVLAYMVRSGGSPVVPIVQRQVNSRWKPVLWFTGEDYCGEAHGDVIDSGPKAKGDDDWEQDVEGSARLIELFSVEGQLVVDPFLGTGTTGVAALRLGRRFAGCDVDAKKVPQARSRLSGVTPPPTD